MKKIAFLFSGQGAQAPGMGKSLWESSSAARETFEKMGAAIGRDIKDLCFFAAQETLNQTQNTQLATLAADLAALRALSERGVFAAMTAGFSLGEYAALVCAGAITEEAAARLVQKRAQFMSECGEGGMAAVLGMENEALEQACREVRGYVVPANYNCPGQTVVSGETAAVRELTALLKARGKRVVPLKVSGAFHSELMRPAARKLRAELDKITYGTGCPVVFNVTGDILRDGQTVAQLMEQQCMRPVYWEKSIRRLLELGAEVFVECGHGGVLTGFLKRICPGIPGYAVQDQSTLEAAADALSRSE